MDFKTIRLVRDGGVATLTLARPERLNAFNSEMHVEIRAALDRVDGESGLRCLVITGEGRGFCSGQDLNDRVMREGEKFDPGGSLERDYNPLVRRLAAFPLPTLAAVNGPAAGAGANVALACDVMVMARSAYLQEAFARIGLVPDAGGTWFLPRLVGLKRALALSLFAEPVLAEECQRLGIAWKVFDDASFRDEVAKLAARLAAGPTLGYRLTKVALNASFDNDLSEQLDLERDCQREAGASSDFREGVKAFMEKRAARFEGR